MPTAEMIADVLTKPLHGAMYTRLSSLITGNIDNLIEINTDRLRPIPQLCHAKSSDISVMR